MKTFSVIALAIGVAACQAPPSGQPAASASSPVQTSAEPSRAPAFAQAACGDCHAVERPYLSPNPEAPAFADIANRKGLTAATLSYWLRDAHNYPEAMDFDLEGSHVDELTTYILTLRDPDYEPPTY